MCQRFGVDRRHVITTFVRQSQFFDTGAKFNVERPPEHGSVGVEPRVAV